MERAIVLAAQGCGSIIALILLITAMMRGIRGHVSANLPAALIASFLQIFIAVLFIAFGDAINLRRMIFWLPAPFDGVVFFALGISFLGAQAISWFWLADTLDKLLSRIFR